VHRPPARLPEIEAAALADVRGAGGGVDERRPQADHQDRDQDRLHPRLGEGPEVDHDGDRERERGEDRRRAGEVEAVVYVPADQDPGDRGELHQHPEPEQGDDEHLGGAHSQRSMKRA
jgi:hypothetical protein